MFDVKELKADEEMFRQYDSLFHPSHFSEYKNAGSNLFDWSLWNFGHLDEKSKASRTQKKLKKKLAKQAKREKKRQFKLLRKSKGSSNKSFITSPTSKNTRSDSSTSQKSFLSSSVHDSNDLTNPLNHDNKIKPYSSSSSSS
jgi:hypothetical protein